MTGWRQRSRRPVSDPVMPPLEPLSEVPAFPAVSAPSRPSDAHRAVNREAELRPAERWRKIMALAEAMAQHREESAALAAGLAYPVEAYDQFRRDYPLPPPPAPCAQFRVTVAIDARTAAPFLIRATLRSLQDQSVATWRALVIAPTDIATGPIGSFAATDDRIVFADRLRADAIIGDGAAVLVDAGTALDPAALAWLGFALDRTHAVAAFADYDHGIADPAFRILRSDPMLYGVFDQQLCQQVPPAVVVLAAGVADKVGDGELLGGSGRLRALNACAALEGIAAVPRILATKLSPPLIARGGLRDARDETPGYLTPLAPVPTAAPAPAPRDDRIAVVIPTRDAAGLLARAVDSLRATARMADRLDIIVVDNRSADPETAALFDRLVAEGAARIVPFDSPFNWSLASNIGAAASDASIVAFVNNDIEMLSRGWDDALVAALHQPSVGAVGARLIYPNGTIQHAGVAAGFGPGGAEHEGRGAPAQEPGPGRRYITTHAVASVTGAFLAVRREEVNRIGGFDAARLMIAHSDVDLCLKLRELGRIILYEPAIEAIHHEGATRGLNQTCAAVAWDEGERADLLERWGEALFDDPGISPYWRRGDQPFALLQEPTMREILAHIDRSASRKPWLPRRSAGPGRGGV